MDPTRQSAALIQEISEPDPPICGTTMVLLMLFNYFGYQGPQNRFRAVIRTRETINGKGCGGVPKSHNASHGL